MKGQVREANPLKGLWECAPWQLNMTLDAKERKALKVDSFCGQEEFFGRQNYRG